MQAVKFMSDDKEYSIVLLPDDVMQEVGLKVDENIIEVDKKRKRIILKGC
ncbi:MAG: hypothetical protein ACP5GE_04980 [Thermoplasmata archaeon]